MLAATLLAFAHADSRNLFAPQPVYTPAMNYGQMQAMDYAQVQVGAPYGYQLVDSAEAYTYVQPAEESDSSALVYATAAVFVGTAILVAKRGQKPSVAEPDLEAATGAAKVAMLFSSGSSSRGKKAAPKKGKKAPAKSGGFFGGGAKKAPARAAPVDDDDLFVHEGTRGFQGDDFAFVYRQGLAN